VIGFTVSDEVVEVTYEAKKGDVDMGPIQPPSKSVVQCGATTLKCTGQKGESSSEDVCTGTLTFPTSAGTPLRIDGYPLTFKFGSPDGGYKAVTLTTPVKPAFAQAVPDEKHCKHPSRQMKFKDGGRYTGTQTAPASPCAPGSVHVVAVCLMCLLPPNELRGQKQYPKQPVFEGSCDAGAA
jgi:hypothetical protein